MRLRGTIASLMLFSTGCPHPVGPSGPATMLPHPPEAPGAPPWTRGTPPSSVSTCPSSVPVPPPLGAAALGASLLAADDLTAPRARLATPGTFRIGSSIFSPTASGERAGFIVRVLGADAAWLDILRDEGEIRMVIGVARADVAAAPVARVVLNRGADGLTVEPGTDEARVELAPGAAIRTVGTAEVMNGGTNAGRAEVALTGEDGDGIDVIGWLPTNTLGEIWQPCPFPLDGGPRPAEQSPAVPLTTGFRPSDVVDDVAELDPLAVVAENTPSQAVGAPTPAGWQEIVIARPDVWVDGWTRDVYPHHPLGSSPAVAPRAGDSQPWDPNTRHVLLRAGTLLYPYAPPPARSRTPVAPATPAAPFALVRAPVALSLLDGAPGQDATHKTVRIYTAWGPVPATVTCASTPVEKDGTMDCI